MQPIPTATTLPDGYSAVACGRRPTSNGRAAVAPTLREGSLWAPGKALPTFQGLNGQPGCLNSNAFLILMVSASANPNQYLAEFSRLSYKSEIGMTRRFRRTNSVR
jgi:hypothetical protein